MNGRMLRDRVRRFVESEGMLTRGDRVLVALSGGADSICLLLLLRDMGYAMVAAHCNFHLRGEESMRDERFVEDLCSRLEVKLRRVDFNTLEYAKERGMSIELAARELRYNFFRDVMGEEKCDALAVGHHKDDNAETFLLNCVRKTGVRGLSAIKAVSRNRQGCRVVRPLLCVSRQEIVELLRERGEQWVTDSTNLKDDVARNKVRLSVMPVLKDINRGVVDNLCETIANAQELMKIYEDWTQREKRRCAQWRDEGCTLHIDRERVAGSVSPISVMHELLSPLGFNDTQVRNLLTAKGYRSNREKGPYEMTLPNGRRVMVEVKWKEINITVL